MIIIVEKGRDEQIYLNSHEIICANMLCFHGILSLMEICKDTFSKQTNMSSCIALRPALLLPDVWDVLYAYVSVCSEKH